MRWPLGISLALWRWLRGSRGVARGRLRTEVISEIHWLPRRGGERLQDARDGVGPAYQRRYTARIRDTALNSEQLIEHLCTDVNAASPSEVAVFDKTSGMPEGMDLDDEYLIHVPGPWNCPVRVVERSPQSFRFTTLQGHLEAGEIEFRATDTEQGGLVFTIESWTRSGDRLADVLYDRLRIAKEMQLHMWTHFCTRVAEMCGGRLAGDVEVRTERSMVPGDSRFRPVLVTDVLTTVFARAFRVAARLRRGRPLAPTGLVLDATLRLHGTPRFWGAALLDDRGEVRGVARLSRSLGLPWPFPDVLGLALRWRQPGRMGSASPVDLLLATTGNTVLCRHLLRPRTRWSPAFYGSLLPYEAGDRRIMLGAVATQTPAIPAMNSALARAADERPIRMELVMTTGFGPWERFGELILTGPVRHDDAEPVRFDPARHPIPGLRPAGLLQRMRGPAYAAVHQDACDVGDGGP
jgi:hypothetical protein